MLCMSSSLLAAFVAFVVALSGFAGVSLSTPAGYPIGSVIENGLIRAVVFEEGHYDFLDDVRVRLVYRNPSDRAVSFNLTYPVRYVRYFDGRQMGWGGSGGEGMWEIITVPAGGEYTVCDAGFRADDAVGWCEIEWDGVRSGAEIGVGEVVPRIVTDKRYYRVGEGGGTAVYELYNPTGHNVTSNLPGCMRFDKFYPDGAEEGLSGVCMDWVWGNVTIPPRGSFRVYSFYFSVSSRGSFTIVGAGARTTVNVLPFEP